MLLGVVVALCGSAGASVVVRQWLASRSILDVPSERSSHDRPVVRGGGIAVATGLVCGWGVTDLGGLEGWTGVGLAALGFGAIGLVEDLKRDRPIALRLGLMLAVSAGSAALLLEGSGHSTGERLVLSVLIVGWLVAFANVTNFMDGINGITGLTTMAAAGSMAAVALAADPEVRSFSAVCLVVVAAAAGFLPYNAPVARMFLGDTGSYLLGATLAASVVLGARSGLHLVALCLPLVPYVADSALTLVRRMARRERWWEPHREHAYQRLVQSGWTHLASASLMAALTALGGGLGVLVELGRLDAVVAVLLLCVLSVGYVLLPSLPSLQRRAAA